MMRNIITTTNNNIITTKSKKKKKSSSSSSQKKQQQHNKKSKSSSSSSFLKTTTDKILLLCFTLATIVCGVSIFLIPQDLDDHSQHRRGRRTYSNNGKTNQNLKEFFFQKYKQSNNQKDHHIPDNPALEASNVAKYALKTLTYFQKNRTTTRASSSNTNDSNKQQQNKKDGTNNNNHSNKSHNSHHHHDKKTSHNSHTTKMNNDNNKKQLRTSSNKKDDVKKQQQEEDEHNEDDEYINNAKQQQQQQQQDNNNNNNNNENESSNNNNENFLTKYSEYHTVFSTGCSVYQDWQSYVFFYHAMKSKQEGHITRIVSGCDESKTKDLQQLFNNIIKPMSPTKFHLHFTPDYSKSVQPTMRPFKYYNKPYGMKHWLEHKLGYSNTQTSTIHDNSMIILLDPDQIILRPFIKDFTNSTELYRIDDPTKHKFKVEHGSPFAQQYGFGLQWLDKTNITNYLKPGEPKSPIETMSRQTAKDYYWSMGPPYIATSKDMYTIVSNWCKLVPYVRIDYPFLLAEMFGYNLAAAHTELKHTITYSFMVSDVYAGKEGWPLISKVTNNEDICYNYPKEYLPHVIHYCQRYLLGNWFIGKYKLRKDFISCNTPLLREPPSNLGTLYDYSINPSDGTKKVYGNPKHIKYMTFMICHMIKALNEAAIYYKDNHCHNNNNSTISEVNYDKTYVLNERLNLELKKEEEKKQQQQQKKEQSNDKK